METYDRTECVGGGGGLGACKWRGAARVGVGWDARSESAARRRRRRQRRRGFLSSLLDTHARAHSVHTHSHTYNVPTRTYTTSKARPAAQGAQGSSADEPPPRFLPRRSPLARAPLLFLSRSRRTSPRVGAPRARARPAREHGRRLVAQAQGAFCAKAQARRCRQSPTPRERADENAQRTPPRPTIPQNQVAYFYDPEVSDYYYGGSHPMK